MAIRKLRAIDGSGYVSLSKDDLRLEGLVDEDGEIVEGQSVHVRHEGDGEWRLRLLGQDDCIIG